MRTAEFKKRRKFFDRLQREKHRIKFRARGLVNCYIRRGKIIRPNNCLNCLEQCKPEAHHEDYTKQLEIMWLCKKCHVARDKKLKELVVPLNSPPFL